MTRGRKPVATFCSKTIHLDETATRAGNIGVYTVESMKTGLCYFFEDESIVIATASGYMKTDLKTAELIAREIADISADFRQNRRSGRLPMNERDISKMLEVKK